MKSERGLALVSALMMLAFLTVVGGALLSSTTVDLQIGANYRTNAQLRFVTEAGIEAGREGLRNAVETQINASGVDAIDTLAEGVTEVLKVYDGTDLLMATALVVDTLLDTGVTDDVPYRNNVAVTSGGRTIGTYTLFIRNDAADGAATNTDTNEVVTLVSIGRIGTHEMLIEVDLKKGRFPTIPAALTLDGPVPNRAFGPGRSTQFEIDGNDAAGGPSVSAVGVIDGASDSNVSNEISSAPDRSDAYCGSGTTFPEPCNIGADPGPDVEDISGQLEPTMTTVSGINDYVAAIESNATSTTCPSGNVGSVASPVIVVVTGDCVMQGYDTGWGQLVVKGALTMGGNVEWNGFVLVVDPASCDTIPAGGTHYAATIAGGTVVNGGMFIVSTFNHTMAEVCVDTTGSGNGGIFYDSEKLRNAAQGLPFKPIAIWHY